MNINSINPAIHHAKSIIVTQRSEQELPFQEVLSSDRVQKYTATIECRERIYTPDVTLYAFLSQVIAEDQSCQAAAAPSSSSFCCTSYHKRKIA